MKPELHKFITSLDESYYKCLLDYVAIPNQPDIAVYMHVLLVKHGNTKVNYISESLEAIRAKYDITYNELQKYIRTTYN